MPSVHETTPAARCSIEPMLLPRRPSRNMTRTGRILPVRAALSATDVSSIAAAIAMISIIRGSTG